jgi:large subunit ribosomal protein L1
VNVAVKNGGKKFAAAKKKVEPGRRYDVEQAVALVKECAFAKFDETVELAMRLGVDPKHADQMVRGAVALPHGVGSVVRVLVFAKGDKEKEAKAAGADFTGAEDLIQKISEGWMEFDQAIATPDLMGQVGKIGRILGPRGLMPNPKVGTVTFDVAKMVKELKAGRVEFRTEKAGIVQLRIGKVSFKPEQLAQNCHAVLDLIMKLKPASAKGTYVRSITLSSTMGPGIDIDTKIADAKLLAAA